MKMVKQTLSISIDDDIILKIKKIAEENNMKISEVASKVFETGFRFGEPIQVKCPMCNYVYSNKEGFCPKCKKELDEREQDIIKETEIANLQHRLDLFNEWRTKGLRVTDNEYNKIKDRIEELKSKLTSA
jgi:RNA polymerase subunit RPABC4/transcription elongation factor Spt4